MIRLLHFADLHLGMENYGRLDPNTGLSSRLGDFLHAFDAVIEHALTQEIDLVVFAGDAFKNRDPSPTHQREFARRIRRLSEANIPTFLLVGNHDLPNATKRAHAIEIFDTLSTPNVWVSDRPDYLRIPTRKGEVQIVSVPWLTRSHLLARGEQAAMTQQETTQKMEEFLSGALQRLTNKVNDDEPAILVGHGTIASAKTGSERGLMLGNDFLLEMPLLRDKRYDYVALGHIHKHQVLNDQPPVVYSGSIERIDFGEDQDDKGFIVAEIDDGPTRWEFIKTPARQFREVKLDVKGEADPMPFIREQLGRMNLAEAVVKLRIEATAENEPLLNMREIRSLLKEANHIAAIQKQVERPTRLRLGTAQEIASATPRELLARYLEAKQVPPAQKAKLLAKADEIFRTDD